MPHVDSKVKIYVNGKPISTHHSPSKHSKYINFIGSTIPDIVENEETDTFDIDLEAFINKIIEKNKPKRKKSNKN